VLSNIKTLIFLTMVGVVIAGCTDIPSDAPVLPDFQSEIRILNATRADTLLKQDTGDDPVLAIYNTVVTVDRDTVLDTTFTVTFDTTWTLNADSTDSTITSIDVTTDTTITATPDSTVTTKEFAVRTTTFKDIVVNTGDLTVFVDGAGVGTLAYEGVTAYLPYPSEVYTITYTATTTKTADIVVTDSVLIINTEIDEDSTSGEKTVSTAVVPPAVDVAVSVSENVTLGADAQSMVILHDDDGTGNRVSIYHEKFMSEKGTGSSMGLVKVINTNSAGSPLNVSITDGANIAVGLGFTARASDDVNDDTLVENFFSGYAEVPLGSTVKVVNPEGTISESVALTVASGKRQSLIIFGTSTGVKLTVFDDK